MAAAGIDVRHRKHCTTPREDGRCCTAAWQAYVYDKRAGKLIRRTFPSKTAARQWRQDALVALRRGEFSQPTGQTVGDAMTGLLAGMRDGMVLDRSGRRYRPATIRSYTQAWTTYLEPTLAPLLLAEVRRADVQRLVDRMHADGLSGSTIRNKLDPLRVVYRRALEDEKVIRNPTSHLRLPQNTAKARRVVDLELAEQLLDALPDGQRALWVVALYGGLRVGELRALRWDHVDFDAGVIRVGHGWDDAEGAQDTKTAAGVRAVPIAGRVRSELVRHKLATGRSDADLVFGRTAQDAFVRSTIRAHANRAWEAAGLEPLTPHEARHTAASYFAKAGVSVTEAQEALGHADSRTTADIYQHALPGWQQQATAKLDAFIGEQSRAKVLRKSDA